jgi:hypothetical protein
MDLPVSWTAGPGGRIGWTIGPAGRKGWTDLHLGLLVLEACRKEWSKVK